MECPHACLVCCAHVYAVSDHASEWTAYKRSCGDIVIEVLEDTVGILNLEVGNKHTGCLVLHKLTGIQQHETSVHCVFLVVTAITKRLLFAAIDNLE